MLTGLQTCRCCDHPRSGGLTAWMLAFAVVFLAPLVHAQRQAQLPWWDRSPEAKFGSYWIKSDLPAAQTQWIARHLNIMYGEYAKRLASLPVRAEEKLNVLLFANRQDYLLTLRARFGVNPAGTGGLFFVRAGQSALALWVENLPQRRIEHVLQHEGFHQFAYSRFGNDLPTWVNEGLAELFGQAVLVGDQLILGQNPPRVIETVQDAIERDACIPFRRMLNMTAEQWSAELDDNSALLHYHQAWSMVHFLVYADGGRYADSFDAYLRHLNNGLASEEAFRRVFGSDIDAFEMRWKAYAQAATPSAFASALERIEFLAEGALELSRRDIRPTSLEALREALREIDFTHVVKMHGIETTLRASDEKNFEIPMDELCPQRPTFILSKPKLTGVTRKQLLAEAANPSPATIETKDLRPRSLRINWLRDPKENTLSYQIEVR